MCASCAREFLKETEITDEIYDAHLFAWFLTTLYSQSRDRKSLLHLGERYLSNSEIGHEFLKYLTYQHSNKELVRQ